jgi:hypothetical protein
VSSDVTAVEKFGVVGLDENGVGVKGAVIIEVGSDSEWSQLKRLSVLKVTGWHNDKTLRPKGGLSENATRRGSHENRNTIGNLIGQSPVILMGVTDDYANESRVVGPESSDLWKWDDISSFGFERSADIEHEASTSRLDLDTTAPDLVCPSVDLDLHESTFTLSSTVEIEICRT